MLNKVLVRTLRTTISDLIVVLLLLLVIINIVYYFEEEKITSFFDTVNVFFIKEENNDFENIKIDLTEDKKLTHYPLYGEEYGNIKIDSIGVDLPLFYGDSLDVLKNGVGQSIESYFPGEGGSILCMGHNFKSMLRDFSKLNLGDIIKVTTDYGEFNYKIYDMRILEETDVDQAPIQKEKEVFMIYTCYPFNNIGYATQRYMVYAEPIED